MTDHIVIITGGRDLTDKTPVWAFLDEQLAFAKRALCWLIVYQGECETGADRFARDWANTKRDAGESVDMLAFPPDLAQWGTPAAYHIRNREMVRRAASLRDEIESTVIAGAFPGKGNGTRETIKLLTKAGIETRVVEGCK